MVFSTTLDDAVWLVPYVGSATLSTKTRAIHALLFVSTLEGLVLSCILVYSILYQGVIAQNKYYTVGDVEREEILSGSLGAILCWSIAAFLYVKKWLKRRSRRRREKESHDKSQSGEEELLVQGVVMNKYNNEDEQNEEEDRKIDPHHPSICAILTFTTLGAFDEISYFPALLLGHIFTPMELCLGTMLASMLILFIITFFLSRFKPVIDFLDSIPLYGIISAFAIVLTLGVFFDV
eukprot:CAMPEP_0184860650 /NCGR_PEP_ID=MMETSP0580-20130426/5511_1 /TAXON_ID=1118495 /ORGANISM="Dactyliosolen fragilissimus" /LENGTH=235 /DNA_ID=CAMNT_0027357849 /DNA_START=85 /DNA_END=788 /DNA_ORIENTATION=-